jgi:ubiquitin C-terminal hydrolase
VPPRYQLIGVVNHFGIIDSGHYVSDVKGAHGQGKWYECNDEQVKEANIKKQGNVSEWAYMLFYKRMTH